MGISVVLLAYKEEENLRILLPEIKKYVGMTGEEYEVLVIDTAKPMDNTRQVCEENGAIYINQESPAFGGAFRTGIKYAKMDKFLILDSDGSHDPSRIPAIYDKFTEGFDVVIGSRYAKGGVTNDSKSSVIMSGILNTAFRTVLGIKAKDISTDYRMYNTKQLKATETKCLNYDVLQEVLLRLKLNKPGLTIGEVPITFNKRMFGESKRRLIPFILSYIKTIFDLLILRIAKTDKKFELLRNIVLYGIFGVCAAGIEFLVFSLLVLSVFGKIPEAANVIGAVCGFTFTFLTNTYWNFKKSDHIARRLVSYGLICLLGMALSTGAINLLKDSINIFILKLILLVAVSVVQFVLNKLITYKK